MNRNVRTVRQRRQIRCAAKDYFFCELAAVAAEWLIAAACRCLYQPDAYACPDFVAVKGPSAWIIVEITVECSSSRIPARR